MHLMLTMAGRYTRFGEFSAKIPKYLLPLSNRTILHHVLKPLLRRGDFNDVFLIANKRDIAFRAQILDTVAEFGVDTPNVIFIDDTPGQLDTALEGLRYFESGQDSPVVVHNVDTILYDRNFMKIKQSFIDKQAECIVDVFTSNNREYSYVLAEEEKVFSIVEKRVISNIASSGCYCFSNPSIALQYMELALEGGKHYISEAIFEMIQDKKRVYTSDVKTEQQTVVLGTPEEYLSSMANIRAEVNCDDR